MSVCLLRFIFKLESQVKQLEHENQARARFSSHSNARPSAARWVLTILIMCQRLSRNFIKIYAVFSLSEIKKDIFWLSLTFLFENLMVNRWMSKRWLCCKVSTASSTIPMSCRYPAEVRQSQILPAGRHPQLSSTTAAESLIIFKQISQFSTRSSHQGWDALQTPLQSVAAAGGSLFIIWMLFFLIFQMICIYIFFKYCSSPSEDEHSLAQPRYQDQSQRREASCSLTPMMRALIELEEAKATESRAPCKSQKLTHVYNHTISFFGHTS